MNKIFIDTNIYLRFFDSNAIHLKKLIDALLEISDKIFITKQIVSEIERNKLNVFNNSIGNYTRDLEVKEIKLPEHVAASDSMLPEDWNNNRKELRKENIKLTKDLDEIFGCSLDKISKSEDSVSKKLRVLYENAIEETAEELEAARLRKEKGNPPGKTKDALGDQISWEQFIRRSPSFNEIWIITNDLDYAVCHKGSWFLNPFLYSELIVQNPNIKVNCFNDLASGYESFAKKNKITDTLDAKMLKEIRQEEKELRAYVQSSNIESIGYDVETQTLEIGFLNGSVYQYFDVPEQVYDGLMSADSHGRYLASVIKGHYRYSRV